MIDSLSDYEILKLRELLGFDQQYLYDEEEENVRNLFGCSWADKPSLTVELSEETGGEPVSASNAGNTSKNTPKPKRTPLQPVKLSEDLINAMFEGSDTENEAGSAVTVQDETWDLPKLKGSEKGPAISQSLADLINMACTSQCATDDIIGKYMIPGNCDKLCSPMVNNEIWKIMSKRAQSYDRCFSDIQNLVATGIVPVIKLLDVVKPHIAGNSEAKTLFSDMITLLGQVQFNLSLRRRYMIKPNLKKKYQPLCHISTPVSTQLFGDDVAKFIKNCDTGVSIAKENYYSGGFRPYRGRSSFRGGNFRGPRAHVRYHPYSQSMSHGYSGTYRGDYGTSGYPRGFSRPRFGAMRGKRQPTSVMAPPNETA